MSRVHLAEYGSRIEAYDRPVLDERAVLLGAARRSPKPVGGLRGWHVAVGDTHKSFDTKGEAKTVLKTLARQALQARSGGAR